MSGPHAEEINLHALTDSAIRVAPDRRGGVARGDEPLRVLNSGRQPGVSQRMVKAGTPTPDRMAVTLSRFSLVLRHWATG